MGIFRFNFFGSTRPITPLTTSKTPKSHMMHAIQEAVLTPWGHRGFSAKVLHRRLTTMGAGIFSDRSMKLITGPWTELQHWAAPLRTEVFVREQGVPQELEWDEEDHSAVHAVCLSPQGQVLATGRLLVQGPGQARIGRMAVLATHRGLGLGRQVLRGLMAVARERGDRLVCLHAQTSARGFYEREGFVPQGEVFMEAGIEHIEMSCLLTH